MQLLHMVLGSLFVHLLLGAEVQRTVDLSTETSIGHSQGEEGYW